MLRALGLVSAALSRLAFGMSVLGLLAMTATIAWQVIARYGLNAAPAWIEQAGLFLMIWFILFAAAAGVRERFHIRLTLLQDGAAPELRRVMVLASHLVVLGFGLAMAVGGAGLVAQTWSHVIPTLGVPRGAIYLPVAAAGGMIALFAAEQAIADWTGNRVAPTWS